ncbi:RluA family pseudouridine synthase [Sphingorhabdus contaminans]|uniref:Ribosomal large subunit pseudouridine synthase D n=1 Tax=Sphingorhabdus contaminans TaxID=1343899 RepID=A0A553WJR7_9SPHN|nr:RluA family pseudouridine synthase [Sphingorhabdus contaminans]TSB04881.1 RluA family pseudouridine synthase [Sphingorhabdus contaminans]
MSKNDEKGIRQFVVEPDDDGIRLDRWFKRHLPDASFNVVSRWSRTGQLRVDGKRATPGDRLTAGQAIRVPPADPTAAANARPVRRRRELTEDEMEFALSMVIHKDDAALVINKPAGLATQGGTKTENHVDGLLDALFFELDSRPKLVHRLDKDTSGALLLARTSRSAGHFSKAFSSRTARKVYWALVVGVPDIADGFIDLPIGKQPGSGGEKMHVDEQNGQSARTRYRIVERAGNTCAWVELQPYTGRTHQLRVHMAAIGHPIVGDGKYGGKDAFLTGTISRKMHLHARRLRIDHPQGHQIDVRADLPPHMQDSFADLGFDIELGDALVLDAPKFSETAEGKKRLAANIAKSARKERKGERRSRGTVSEKPKDKKRSQLATAKKIALKKPVIKKAVRKKPMVKK